MPRPRKTEPQRIEMRQHILDAAHTLLLEKGLQGVSLRRIAACLGITHMALFTYFPSQAAILEALVERELERLQSRLEPFVEQARRQDAAAALREALAFFASFALHNPQLYRLLWLAPLDVSESSTHPVDLGPFLYPLAQIIEAGVDGGAFETRNAFLAAGVAFGTVNAPLLLFYAGRLKSAALRDSLVADALEAAMRSLKRDTGFIRGKWK
jgi:AcrR family transcriptional regulator